MGAVPSLDAPQLTPAALAYDLVRAESNRAREKRAVSQRGVGPAGADGAPLSTATRQAVPPQPSSRRATPQIAPPAASASPQLPAIAEGSVRDEVERALEVGRQRAAVTIQAARRRHHVRQTLGFREGGELTISEVTVTIIADPRSADERAWSWFTLSAT